MEKPVKKKIYLRARFFPILLFLAFFLNAQSKHDCKAIPQCSDISVNDIYLLDAASAEKVIGKDIELEADDEPTCINCAHFFNRQETEVLSLILHGGDDKNRFSEIWILRAAAKPKSTIHHLSSIDHFITGKGIKLGMRRTEVVKALGRKNSSEKIMDNMAVLRYKFDNHDSSHAPDREEVQFLECYSQIGYFAEYKFRSDILVEFIFGFENP